MLALNNLKLVKKPEQFHGQGVKSNFFEGWYYKTLLQGSKGSIIFIPGVYFPSDTKSDQEATAGCIPAGKTPGGEKKESEEESNVNVGKRREAHAFVMVFRNPGTSQCLYYWYPPSEFSFTNNTSDSGYTLHIGQSTFTENSINVDLDARALIWPTPSDEKQFYAKALAERKALGIETEFFASFERTLYSIKGKISLSNIVKLRQTLYEPGIMGPFGYLPFMECYHGVVSLHHTTSGSITFTNASPKGELCVKEETISVDEGTGYIEKDHGFNFPKSWIWIQTSSFQKNMGSALMISVADVPLLSDIGVTSKLLGHIPKLGPALLNKAKLTGFLVLLHLGSTNQTYNLSLFTGAKISKMEFSSIALGPDTFQICSLAFTLKEMELEVTTKKRLGTGVPLPGPSFALEGMHLIVEESLDVSVSVCFKIKGQVVLQDLALEAGMEVVGSMESMKSRI